MTNQTQDQATKYFNLHTSGIGYVNRIREVKPKKGDSFWACNVAGLRGSEDNVEYTYFDCRVSGTEAIKLIKRLAKTIEKAKAEGKEDKNLPKILIGFTIGDIYTETFLYESGNKKGETGVTLKGRLLHISLIKVDGKEVYKAPSKEDNAEVTDSNMEGVNNDQADSSVPSTIVAEADSKPAPTQPEPEPQATDPVEQEEEEEAFA